MADINVNANVQRISTLGKVRILVEQVVGSPSQAQISQAVASYIDSHQGALSPLSAATKSALLQIAQKVAYKDKNGQSYYDALDAALNAKALLSITAVYTQSGTVYDTDSLDSLKDDLVVTAYYDDGTSAVVSSGYTLSGELTEGTSTITVTFSGKTATFEVTVRAWTVKWDYTQGGLPQTVAPNDWLVVSGGNTVSFDQSKGMKWYSNYTGFNIRPKNYQYTSSGVMEVVMNIESLTHHNIRATLGTATDCIIGFMSTQGVRVNGISETPIPNTVPSMNTDYVLRVERDATTGKVYLDGKLLYSGELRALSQDNNMLIGEETHSSAYSTVYIKAIRFYHEN